VLLDAPHRNSYESPANCIRRKGVDLFSRVFSRSQDLVKRVGVGLLEGSCDGGGGGDGALVPPPQLINVRISASTNVTAAHALLI